MSSNNTAPMSGTIEGGLGMSGEWREVAIRDICIKIGSGATPRGGKESYRGGDTNLIRSQNVYNEGFRTDGLVRIDERQASELRNVEVIAGDVLLNITGDSVARCCTAPMAILPARVNQHVAIIRTKPEIADSAFLRYTLVSAQMQDKLMSMSSAGATRPALTKGMIERLVVHLPPLPEQRRIAKILGDLDDKIELNRKMNETLEQMARALFKSWFIDFDPVRAKMEGRIPQGMDPETAALFPSRLVESELGIVPEGWEVKKLGDIAELVYGKPLKAEDRRTGPVCVYGANGIVGVHDEKLVSGPGIVVGRKGNPGTVTWAHGDFYPIDTTFYVNPNGECRSLLFLYFALYSSDLSNLSADSAVPGLNRNHAYMSMQLIPQTSLVGVFDKHVAPIFASIHYNESQSRTLASLRDTLLPQLMRGEGQIPNEK